MNRRGKVMLSMLLAVVSALALVAGACGDSGGGDSAGGDTSSTLRVPEDHSTIQEAVDAAEAGDLVLISPGVYKEAVKVTTEDLTIRGLDRNEVILDGEFELDNGIFVVEADGVAVENMTARNYTSNGFYWTGVEGYRGSYLTAYRNGDYGVYAFDSVEGQFDNSLGSGSPDAGFYIGECYPCTAVIDNVISEYNGLGYSGTNSGGDLYIVNSTFRHNRAGIVPNSGSYELCYPGRENTIVGNLVHDNNEDENPAIDVALLAHGNGILVAGSVKNVVERNRVWNHDRTGIGLVPFPEEDASDLAPDQSEWGTSCEETHDAQVPPIPEEDCKSVDGLLEGCVVFWNPYDNRVVENVVEGSGVADLAVGSVDLLGTGETTDMLRNCFSGNTFSTSAPAQLEALAPCEGTGSGDWNSGALDLLGLFGQPAAAPPKETYKSTPVPEPQPNMPDASTSPARPATDVPARIDLASIQVPDKPAGA
ncbi:MAG: right-handed parallel beta-helix repeat-containing protein [Microthrixaceae bacterium]